MGSDQSQPKTGKAHVQLTVSVLVRFQEASWDVWWGGVLRLHPGLSRNERKGRTTGVQGRSWGWGQVPTEDRLRRTGVVTVWCRAGKAKSTPPALQHSSSKCWDYRQVPAHLAESLLKTVHQTQIFFVFQK